MIFGCLADQPIASVQPSSHELSLKGRVAIVTGGSRGIGRSIAEALAANGAAVGIMFREREAPAREFEAVVRAGGGPAWAGQCQIRDEASGAAFFEAATSRVRSGAYPADKYGINRRAHAVFHRRA